MNALDGPAQRPSPGGLKIHLPRPLEARGLAAQFRASVRSSEVLLVLIAAVVGCGAGAAVTVLSDLAQAAHVFFYKIALDQRLSAVDHITPFAALTAPVIGGLAIGLIELWRRHAKARSAVDPVEANALRGGRMSLRDSLVVSLQTLISNGCGASVGLEAGYTQIGSGLASRLGIILRLRRNDLRIMVGCGAAGAIAAAFGAPLTGAFYAFELIVGVYSITNVASIMAAALTAAAHDRINAGVRVQYAWADKTADRYADLHRSTFVLTSFLTPLAVIAALAPIAFPPWRTGLCAAALMSLEFLLVVALLGLLRGERKGEWHKRWMECRVLAEQLRQLRLVTPVGGGRPQTRPRPHLSNYGDPTQSWMSWTVRAVARDLGLPNAVVTPDYVESCLTDLDILADGQLRFHEASATRAETIHRRLHRWSILLLWLTVAGVLLHIATTFAKPTETYAPYVEGALVLIAAVCPALGAAFASINNQGEFQRMAKRSEAMSAFFAAHRDAIRALRASPTPPRMENVEPLARQIAEAMVDEVSDWRIVMNDRALGV